MKQPILICFISAIWVSKLSQTSSQEVSSQDQNRFSNAELHQLLYLLDDSPSTSKELASFDNHPLLNLGELLLDDDNDASAGSQNAQQEKTTTVETTTTPTPATTTTTTTTTTAPTTTTTTPPPENQIEKRIDPNGQPSNEDLIQQLSLFNSLLMSLSKENESTSTTSEPQQPPPLNAQQVALLNSLFGSFSPLQTTDPSSTFLRRQTETPPSSTPTPPSPSSPDIVALTELLTKISKAPVGPNGNLNLNSILPQTQTSDHLNNFHNSNTNMDAAASTQLSGLLNLLGALGSLSQLQQTTQQLQQPSLFNFGTSPATVASPISNNFLTGLLQPQAQPSQQNPNIFGNLFQPQVQANQAPPFNFGNLLTPGFGSVLSTMSNILGGSGANGKPRVRGKGMDTRLGLGYRFGDAADAQIMWDIGPQLFTEPLQNEVRYPMTKKKRQDSSINLNPIQQVPIQQIQAQAQAEKEQQQIAATRRHFQQAPPFANQNRRQFHINPPTSRTPSTQNLTPYAQEQAIKELWQLMEMKKQMNAVQPQRRQHSSYLQNQSPNNNYIFPMSQADLYQMGRSKQVMKRASIPPNNSQPQNLNPTSPTVSNKVVVEGDQYEQNMEESRLNYKTQHPSQQRPFPRNDGPRNPNHNKSSPPQSPPGLFNLNIFGRFRGPPPKQRLPQRNPQQKPHRQEGSASQMSRWDIEHADHRFENFKNTNGELVMTDSNANDRFYARNTIRNANSRDGV